MCHIETSTGHLSNSVTGPQLARTIALLNLHNYHVLDRLGPAGRDFVMSLASLAISTVATMGLFLFLKSSGLKMA